MRILKTFNLKPLKTAWIALAAIVTLTAPLLTGSAFAAPIWLERNFVQSPELLDPLFEQHNQENDLKIDHKVWDGFLKTYIKESDIGVNLVDYTSVTSDDKTALSGYIEGLSEVDIAQFNRDEQLGFWINLYNAITVQLIIENYPLDSIRDLGKPWDSPVVTIKGVALTLNNIEHGIIRPIWKDNRIHYAVNCASIGCPNLMPVAFTGENLNQLLDQGARDYINHPRGIKFSKRRGRITVSKIYGWYNVDFGSKEREILNHIRQYADDDLKKRLEGKKSIAKYNYDWALNDASVAQD